MKVWQPQIKGKEEKLKRDKKSYQVILFNSLSPASIKLFCDNNLNYQVEWGVFCFA